MACWLPGMVVERIVPKSDNAFSDVLNLLLMYELHIARYGHACSVSTCSSGFEAVCCQ